MPDTAPDAHVHLALHPQHPSAVVATLTGSTLHTARATLASQGFRPVTDHTMLLVRIDHEEPYYANITATLLRDAGITVDITDQLQEEIDTEWTWANHPMTWLDRDEIRLVSADAQKIHDDITSGLLVIHLHAHDGHTTCAVGSYQHADSVHLHGENHLRVVSGSYDTPGEAIADFERLYGDAVRPGPPPPTDTEQQTAQAFAGLSTSEAASAADALVESQAAKSELVPVFAADAGDHEALFKDFLDSQPAWEMYRPYDETTIASHESLTLRVEFEHETGPRDINWTVAVYETPVSDRLWHSTATASTPTAIISALLDTVAAENVWGPRLSPRVNEAAIAEATRPLADAGWKQSIDGRYISWAAPGPEKGGVQFDAFAAQKTNGSLPVWTIWGGHAVHQPTWALQLSAHAPTALVQDIAFEMAEGQGSRLLRPAAGGPVLHTAQAPARVAAAPPAAHLPGRRR
ncbi:hypothetical protein GCM10010211_19620 [Streptomyces albospinus]|uniref:DUF317 domain-containing protein n=1 Tax=Streptomyces albospinus TaxID=285515 RepID=A0ABQ2UWW5_9ACTN|nr:DUF317 domain-containing protein [Streptomyces albospinus]GGU55010.1 hypothetical protein GCM10010211_19620 [Streptomyces albospinus]